MGMFDSMLGNMAKKSQAMQGSQERFTQLKQKYQSVLNKIEQSGVQLQNLHVENDKLFVRGIAPSETVKNEIWNEVKRIDPTWTDLQLDLTIGGGAGAEAKPQFERYTVKAGDTLSKIAQQFYGDKMAYQRIFEANRDILHDPNKIEVGQVIKVPKLAMA